MHNNFSTKQEKTAVRSPIMAIFAKAILGDSMIVEVTAPFVDSRALPPVHVFCCAHIHIMLSAIFDCKLIFRLKCFNYHTHEPTQKCCA